MGSDGWNYLWKEMSKENYSDIIQIVEKIKEDIEISHTYNQQICRLTLLINKKQEAFGLLLLFIVICAVLS